MGVLFGEELERWSGKQSLPVDRSLVFPSRRSPMEPWSNAPTRSDRARFAACLDDLSQVATEPWSNARERGDRTRHALVDIRCRRVVAESWSSVRRHEDRTRIAVAVAKRGSCIGQGVCAGIAVSIVGLALLLATPVP